MASKVWVCDDAPSARYPVYTRGNVGEVFVEAASPLTWSAYGPHAWDLGWRDALYEMGAFVPDEFRPEGECEVVGCFGGYVYINMSVTRVMAVRIPGLTVEAIDRSLFGDYPDVPPYRPDPRDQAAERTAAVGAWVQRVFVTNPKAPTDEDGRHLAEATAKRPDFAAVSDGQLLEHFRGLRPEARRQFKRHVLNGYGGNVLIGFMAQICEATGAGDLAARLTAAVGDIDSAGQSFDAWSLSRQVRASPALSAAFDRGVDGLLDRLRTWDHPAARRFIQDWDEFIGRWGFIGPSVWEFRSPTYRSDPDIVLRMLDSARKAPDSSAPSVRAASLAADREAAIADISVRLSGKPDLREQFVMAARAAGLYLAARERSKLQCARVIDEGRQALRELGQRLVQRGSLSRWEHVLLVTDGEADAFVADPAAYGDLIRERAAQLEALMGKEPPFVFEGGPPPLSAFKARSTSELPATVSGVQLRGIGVSPGRYTGRARVIASLAVDSELEPGEVIVAATTDAAWGPLFLAAGAVVVETGAVVSHAAIVARELGIPAAVSVAAATRRIKDGDTVTVDGNAGTVKVHCRSEGTH